MLDCLGRKIEYLRISVTEKCNLNCIYCSNNKDSGNCSKEEDIKLTPQEFEKVVMAMSKLGIKSVRITGGEPLIRSDICEIVERIAKIDGISDISMTTNAVLLQKYAKDLKKAGLMRLNISLDSLKGDRLKEICGIENTGIIYKGIELAIESGYSPIRVNTILMRGTNDDEIEDFINLTKDKPIDVRFLELMPMSEFGEENQNKTIKSVEVLDKFKNLVADTQNFRNGPAEYYKVEGYKGRVGFISPISHSFCESCNRIRLTSDGKLRPCLGNNGEVDILNNIRNNENLEQIISDIIYNKPKGHNFSSGFKSHRKMNRIGG